MKKIKLLLSCVLLVAMAFTGNAQDPIDPTGPTDPVGPINLFGCTDFNDQFLGAWQGNRGGVGADVSTNGPGASGGANDFSLEGRDRDGASYIFNDADFAGDWSNRSDCFCWDFRVTTDAGATLIYPSLLLINNTATPNDPLSNANIRAIFRSTFTTTEGADWLHICAPLEFCDAAGNLPSNEYGYWEILDGGDCNSWDSLLQDVTHMIVPIDVFSNPAEVFLWDNFCYQDCDTLDFISRNCELLDVNFNKEEEEEEEEGCCHVVNLTNNDLTTIYEEVVFSIMTSGVEFSQFNPTSGYTVNSSYSGNSNADRVRGITGPNGIPSGNIQDFLNVCFNSTNGLPLTTVEIEVSWIEPANSSGIEYIPCRERITINCIDPPITEGCCDSLENQILNGDFEFGPEGFESDYNLESDISVSSILPGSYGVINTEEANSICDNWMVDDHTTNCDGAGNFLVVNGRTGQTGSSVFWEQTIQVDTSDTYKLCASFKHLEQCCFDVIPHIEVIVNGEVVDTLTINNTVGADPCSWQEYTLSIEPTDFSITIELALNETALGDGNDLAVDDLFIANLPKVPFYISTQDQRPQTSNIMASIFTIAPPTGPTPDDILPSKECKYEWKVAAVENINLGTSPATVDLDLTTPGAMEVGGPFSSTNPSWDLTTTFPGYGGGTPDGNFGNGFFYIALTVYDCECFADSTDAKIVGRFGLKLPNGGSLNNFVLSEASKKAINAIRSGTYVEGTIPTSIFNNTDNNLFVKEPTLQQNEPNPFDNSTTISYFLPSTTGAALIRITGIDGSVLQNIPITQEGLGQVQLNTTRYLEGIYFYSLVIDDRVIETRRMVLTR